MANITKVYLLNVPLENDYKHTLYFANKDAQYEYFISKRVKQASDFSYQRKDHTIRLDAQYDDVLIANYVMYQNTQYSNKWFYAFITDIKYVSDGRTDIQIETDVVQTWLFDYTVKESFVEREHVTDDTIGKNTVPEGLETGEYVCNTHRRDTKLDNINIVVAITQTFDGGKVKGANYNGIYSGVGYRAFSESEYDIVSDFITAYSQETSDEGIQAVFLAPQFLTPTDGTSTTVLGSQTAQEYSISYDKDYYMNGYTPKNNKLKTYPYNYLLVSNNNGASAIYQYEHFAGTTVDFKVHGALCPGCSIRMVPQNYKNTTVNDEEGINLGKYPICNWQSDVYTNWLTQNGMNIGVSLVTGTAQVIGGALATAYTGGIGGVVGVGAITSGVSTITNTLLQVHQQSFTPPQSKGNLNCGDVITATDKNSFHFYNMSIKAEYARIIDEYFTMFGYKVNRVKVPNKNHRSRFWFTKTIDVNIDGAIPMKDMQKIKDCYNTGITFWKSANDINNYSSANTIV